MLAKSLSWRSDMKQIPYWEVDSVWPKAAPMLQRAIDGQDETNTDILYRKLVNAYDQSPMQLWFADTFAIITQIQSFPTGTRKCLLYLCGASDFHDVTVDAPPAMQAIETWAKKFHGCTKMMIYGRKGWLRTLADFKDINTIMEKKI